MQTVTPEFSTTSTRQEVNTADDLNNVNALITAAWASIGLVWPLKNIIACNPLHGLEDLDFEKACALGVEHFQLTNIPRQLAEINRLTIKWCQAFFDNGQATIAMPGRHQGLYRAWQELAVFDQQLHLNNPANQQWLSHLSKNPELVISDCLARLKIPSALSIRYLTLLLTSLPGWASYIKYRTDWSGDCSTPGFFPVTGADYLAMRLVITCLIWPQAYPSLTAPINALNRPQSGLSFLTKMLAMEEEYAKPLLQGLRHQAQSSQSHHLAASPEAQLVFCIDVRSEPFRRALEAQGPYETLGFAGFFGIPVSIREANSGEVHHSCPVLLSPQHTINEIPLCSMAQCEQDQQRKNILSLIKRCYYGLKYTFSPHFALVETIGPWSGAWIALKTFLPTWAAKLKKTLIEAIRPTIATTPIIHPKHDLIDGISGIEFKDQSRYAVGALSMMGLTRNFAPLVIFCGHGSTTENNAFATALDCGACGGREGGVNAQILAKILNDPLVRLDLAEKGILIPEQTQFIAAQHNTTTDTMTFLDQAEINVTQQEKRQRLSKALIKAQEANSQIRCQQFGIYVETGEKAVEKVKQRSIDWAETRPEWGLARNASFIVGHRNLSKKINLHGRAFLHSYQWQHDLDGHSLEVILTAPMVVAQWINSQYLFSTLDNVAYGSGSKVTQNITGKLGVMQGNASDLMHGLPLQSLYSSDKEPYHIPLRLLTIVYAPIGVVTDIIARQPVLQKLFGNGWVSLAVLDPNGHIIYRLQRNLSWKIET